MSGGSGWGKEPWSRADKILFWTMMPLYLATFAGWLLKGCGYWKGF